MPATAQRKQHLNLVETAQMDMTAIAEIPADFDGKLADAQKQLEYLHNQREELEKQKIALELLNHRKQDFLHGQVDLTEKLSGAITAIDRELFESKQEMEDMEQARASFAKYLQKIEGLNPEAWSNENLRTELENAIGLLERADDEYDQAVAYFSGGRRGSNLFGPSVSRKPGGTSNGGFCSNLKNGLAFNLPIIVLGSVALYLYFTR